jgi:hypothetical protein
MLPQYVAPPLDEIRREVMGALLLQRRVRKDPAILNMIAETLRELAKGGVRDREQLRSCALMAARKFIRRSAVVS